MLSKIFSARTARYLFIALCVALALALSYARTFERYELQTYDWRFQLRGPRPIHPDIVHIDIWNDTLGNIGVWPFDRKYHAQLIAMRPPSPTVKKRKPYLKSGLLAIPVKFHPNVFQYPISRPTRTKKRPIPTQRRRHTRFT